MSAAMTRFEVLIPVATTGTPNDLSIQTFLTNMQGITPIITNVTYVNGPAGQVYSYVVYGYITAAQQATALGYLNTLNTALGTPVVCNVWATTSEP